MVGLQKVARRLRSSACFSTRASDCLSPGPPSPPLKSRLSQRRGVAESGKVLRSFTATLRLVEKLPLPFMADFADLARSLTRPAFLRL